ncbi:CHAT domain-containing protein [Mycena venus]|uniref:CHAT domain-containing protein n=1 Tax=Mycena venus TaxID=2733690 RepID=A0A8H6YEM8_9AGAR|nr:CHAT domain-containing protein [Mycena venus]
MNGAGAGIQPDAQELLVMHERILFLPPENDKRGTLLNVLGDICWKKWKTSRMMDYLNQSIYAYKDAVRDDPGNATYLEDLGISLGSRFERLGDLGDLNECISRQEEAVLLTPDGHSDKPARLNNLGVFLRTRFEQLGDLGDLNESISKQQEAILLTPDGHPHRSGRLNNLGNSLQSRFERLGDLGDLNESISKREEAVVLTPEGHPDRPIWLNNLGISLQSRFEQVGDLGDLNASISKQEEAVLLTPDGHSNKPARLNNLVISLQSRFERLGDLSNLNESILKMKEAVLLTPDGDPHRPSRLNNLGNSLQSRFERLGDISDLNESISKRKEAILLTPDGHPNRPSWLNNLGISLQSRFEQLGDLSDLNESISRRDEAVYLTPDGHPDMPGRLTNLGNSLSIRYHQSEHLDDLRRAIHQYTSAACSTTGPTHIRFQAAVMWAHTASIIQDPSILEAYHKAIDLLPELAWLGLSINDRHHQIMQAGSVVRDAAAAAISSGHPRQAVEWLEQGRSIVWGQLLNLRTPVEDLSQKYPDLANQFILLSAQLQGATGRRNDPQFSDSGNHQPLESTTQQSHENALKRDMLLKKIRELEGFQRFLLPKTISDLVPAAQRGPVVFLSAGQSLCHALVLHFDDRVTHVPLAEFTLEHLETMTKSLNHLMPYMGRGDIDRLQGNREGGSTGLEDDFAHILSDLWLRLVKPVLAALTITVSSVI